MTNPAEPSVRVASDTTTDAQTNEANPIIPYLPNEVIERILEFLKLDKNFKALNMVARSNQTMYDLAIPKIYEVVVVNERNVKTIGYGHESESPLRREGELKPRRKLMVDDEEPIPWKPTRKDIATGHTRKLIIDIEPESAIPTSYTRVNEVELGPRTFCEPGIHPLGYWDYPFVKESVENVAPRDVSAPPLHVTARISRDIDMGALGSLLRDIQTPFPFSCEFLEMFIDEDEFALDVAFLLGAVVKYRDTDLDKEEIIREIAGQLDISFTEEDPAAAPYPYVYLCDIPRLVLSADEIRSSPNFNKAAKVKLFDQIAVWPDPIEDSPSAQWEFFDSRVRLVESGFRPSMADLMAFPKPK